MKKTIISVLLLFIVVSMPQIFAPVIPPITEFDPGGGGAPQEYIELTLNIDPYSTFRSDHNAFGHTWVQITNKTQSNLYIGGKSIRPNKTIGLSGNSTYFNPYPLVSYNTEHKNLLNTPNAFSGTVITMTQNVYEGDYEVLLDLIEYYNEYGIYSTSTDLMNVLQAFHDAAYGRLQSITQPSGGYGFSSSIIQVFNTIVSNIPSVWWDWLVSEVEAKMYPSNDLYAIAYGYVEFEKKTFEEMRSNNLGHMIDSTVEINNMRTDLSNAYYLSLNLDSMYNYPTTIISLEESNDITRMLYAGFFKKLAETNYQFYSSEPFNLLSGQQNMNGNTNFAISLWNYAVYAARLSEHINLNDKMLFYVVGGAYSMTLSNYIKNFVPSNRYTVYWNGLQASDGIVVYSPTEYNKRFTATESYVGYYKNGVFYNL